ncbi:uncharacterized protein TNCV_2825791 [Trichonephila clavipes]|nr:uncharacterized protein TNCV_2825791 [Trichonephila clavipes]
MTVDPDLHRLIPNVPSSDKTFCGKRMFQCKKFEYLGKCLVLFCEAQIGEVHSANAVVMAGLSRVQAQYHSRPAVKGSDARQICRELKRPPVGMVW